MIASPLSLLSWDQHIHRNAWTFATSHRVGRSCLHIKLKRIEVDQVRGSRRKDNRCEKSVKTLRTLESPVIASLWLLDPSKERSKHPLWAKTRDISTALSKARIATSTRRTQNYILSVSQLSGSEFIKISHCLDRWQLQKIALPQPCLSIQDCCVLL